MRSGVTKTPIRFMRVAKNNATASFPLDPTVSTTIMLVGMERQLHIIIPFMRSSLTISFIKKKLATMLTTNDTKMKLKNMTKKLNFQLDTAENTCFSRSENPDRKKIITTAIQWAVISGNK
mmetsp:Transcript_27095/g.41496  ORF Transcript_27095/g.41496 Transcript_27095/m.41496 type:complete len:121 (+) Transcript_27095:787-1149(+)